MQLLRKATWLCGILYLMSLGPYTGKTRAEEKRGVLLESGAYQVADLYDFKTGRAKLLVPVLPLNPPPLGKSPIKVAIIDSGVIAQHPQLRGLVIAEKAFVGTDPTDHVGHGTVVALNFVRSYYINQIQINKSFPNYFKVINSPAIISAKVVGSDGRPTLSAVVDAINWVVGQGARIVNISLGFEGSGKEYENLCTIIRKSDALFFAAAGKKGPNVRFYPAACDVPGLMAVGATHNDVVDPKSGAGHVYTESTVELVRTLDAYYLENGLQEERNGDFEAARCSYERSLAENETPAALVRLAYLDFRTERNPERAYKLLQRALQLTPEPTGQAIIHSSLGDTRMLQKRYSEAEVHYQEALKLEPRDQGVRFNLGKTLLILGRPNEALAAFEKVRELNPRYPEIDTYIALARQGR